MTPEQLRASILQYAVEGKLVKQDPNDEPASELLKRIENEKAELIREGKIKKSKKLPAIEKDEKPFDIPDSWEWVRFSELFDIQGGSQPPKRLFSSIKKENMIRLYQIRDYGSNPVPVYIPKDSTKKMTKKGDILLARYGASLGKVFWAEDGGYNVAMAKVIPYFESNNIFKSYLFFYFKSSVYQKFITSNSRSAQAGFNKGDLEKLLMPVPPLKEQKRIVTKIEELMTSINKISK